MSTAKTFPENNLITASDLARAREQEFAAKFTGSIKKLVEALGVTRKIPKSEGTMLKSYKAQGTLESGIVEEGALIPLSHYETVAQDYGEISLKEWRKSTSAKAITDKGYDQAVNMTTDKMVKDIQKVIRSDFFTFIQEGTTISGGATLQKALANAWGALQVLFEDDEAETVHFMNPLDIADYLGEASISTQTVFGMNYVKDFLGLGAVFTNTNVPKGTIISTVKDNIVLYYIPANGAGLEKAFSFTTDETGYIGIHEESHHDTMTVDTVMVSGIKLFAERLDGVVISLIDSTPTLGTLTVTSSAGTADGDTALTVSPSLTSGNSYKYKVATAATEVKYGQNVKSWTTWDGSSDITAATGKVITLVECDKNYRAQLAGSATVTAK